MIIKSILFTFFSLLGLQFVGASEITEFKIDCPYDDFAEESLEFSLKSADKGWEVKGDLVSTFTGYEVEMIATKVTVVFKPDNKTLMDLNFEGINKDGELFGFRFEASEKEFDSGVGYTTSKIIGNRIFICSQAF